MSFEGEIRGRKDSGAAIFKANNNALLDLNIVRRDIGDNASEKQVSDKEDKSVVNGDPILNPVQVEGEILPLNVEDSIRDDANN